MNDYLKIVLKEAAVLIKMRFCALLNEINLKLCKVQSIAFFVLLYFYLTLCPFTFVCLPIQIYLFALSLVIFSF
jgi:hypothetical protein